MRPVVFPLDGGKILARLAHDGDPRIYSLDHVGHPLVRGVLVVPDVVAAGSPAGNVGCFILYILKSWSRPGKWAVLWSDIPTVVLNAQAFFDIILKTHMVCWAGWPYFDLLRTNLTGLSANYQSSLRRLCPWDAGDGGVIYTFAFGTGLGMAFRAANGAAVIGLL